MASLFNRFRSLLASLIAPPPEPLHVTGIDSEPEEVPIKLCCNCRTGYQLPAWQQLRLVRTSKGRTRSGRWPARETRVCAYCGDELTLEYQHYEDHDYTVPPRAAAAGAR